MNRITREMALEAYTKLGMRPVQESWVDVDSKGRKCGCALSVVYCAQIDGGFEGLINRNDRAETLISEGLKLDRSYIGGFTMGFDGEQYLGLNTQAYADGRAAWEAVKHLAGVDVL